MPGRLYALLVGIDAYPSPVPQLQGCVNDVVVFADVLRQRVGADDLDLLTLTDAEATRSAVTRHFTEHLGRASAEDVALFYYSGHGSQQATPEELWPIEPDHRNETIVCFDSRQPGCWDLADKELAILVGGVAASGCHVLVVLDCCHSGGGTRDADEVVRLAPVDPRPRPVTTFLDGVAGLAATASTAATATTAPVASTAPTGPTASTASTAYMAPTGPTAAAASTSRWDAAPRWSLPIARHVLLAACRSSERAKEVTVLGRQRGALSAALETALLGGDGRPSYRDVLRMVTSEVLGRVSDQHPQLESADATELDRPFLGGAIPATPRPLTLSRMPDGWSIDSGAVHGVPEPIGDDTTELAVYPLTGATSGSPLATARVTKVLPDRSLVALAPDLDPGFVYRAVVTSIPLRPMTVCVVGDDAGTAALRAAADNADETLVDLASGTSTEVADLVVEATPSGFVITRPGVTRPLVPVVAGEGREQRTIAALEHVARWLRLSGLSNAGTRLPAGAVQLTIETPSGAVGAGGTVTISYAGDTAPQFTVGLVNTTPEPLWAALLDLTETYGIFTDAFPAGSVALGPGEATSVDLVGQVSDELWQAGTVSLRDQLMVVTGTIEFDPRSLEQAELDVTAVPSPATTPATTTRGADALSAGGHGDRSLDEASNLDRALDGTRTRRLGPSTSSAAVADWRTDSVFVVTSRPR
ncbi:hypothetical protein GCM10027053_41920 [Intrasporangium mesophilum]